MYNTETAPSRFNPLSPSRGEKNKWPWILIPIKDNRNPFPFNGAMQADWAVALFALLSRNRKLIKMTNLPEFNYKTPTCVINGGVYALEGNGARPLLRVKIYNQLSNIGKDTNNVISLIITRFLVINLPRYLNWRKRSARDNVPRPRTPQQGVMGNSLRARQWSIVK